MATKKTTPASKTTTAKPAVVKAPSAKAKGTKAPAKSAPVTKAAAPKAKPATRKAAPKPAATAPKPAAKLTPTTVVAVFDVGYGNALTIRGEGGGLSWDNGALMACEGQAEWVFTAPAGSPLTFKVLINDAIWSTGENYTVPAGQTTIVNPEF